MKLKYFICGFILLVLLFIIGISQAAAATNEVNTNQQVSIHDAHAYPNPFDNEKGETRIKFKIHAKKSCDSALISVIIYDIDGKKVCTRSDTSSLKSGYNTIDSDKLSWGGDNDMGERVANGLYFAKIIVEASNTKVKVVKILVK